MSSVMRTVFVCYNKAAEGGVLDWLRTHTVSNGVYHVFPTIEQPVLYCELSDYFGDWEPHMIDALRVAIGAPFAHLALDVSGRHPGNAEVREAVLALLDATGGVA